MLFTLEEDTGVPGGNLRCQAGTTNPTDMPNGSGQQLRVAAIVPKPSLVTTWPARQVSGAGLAVQRSGDHPSKS